MLVDEPDFRLGSEAAICTWSKRRQLSPEERTCRFSSFSSVKWMLAFERVAKRRVVAVIFPTRIGHYPVEVVEHARDEQIGVALRA